MKTSLLIILAFIFVGCETSQQSASLTTEQATTIAIRLANDKASTLYQHQPFVAGQPAQFVAGHWLWVARQGFGRSDIQATVELAADARQTALAYSYSTARTKGHFEHFRYIYDAA